MRNIFEKSIITRVLWPLCTLQVIVLLTSVSATFFSLLDSDAVYSDRHINSALQESISIADGRIRLEPSKDLASLADSNPNLWYAIANDKTVTHLHGQPPAELQYIIQSLPYLASADFKTFPSRKELAFNVELKTIDGIRVHIAIGGTRTTSINYVVFEITKILSPFFLIPLVLFTLLATPIILIRSTKELRHLAKAAQALDITDQNSFLPEASIPREFQALVSAFNGAMHRTRSIYQSRDRFLRDAAHELRMPIAILMARIETLEDPKAKMLLLNDLYRLSNIAEQLLDLQRLQSTNIKPTPTDLVHVAKEVLSDIAPMATKSCDSLELEAPSTPVWVMAEAASLSRVMVNLLQNSLTHAQGKGTIILTVELDGTFSVQDQGPGIPVESLEYIFTPFYRTHQNKPGHGLGLHLAQEIIKQHHGTIQASNATNGGAIFTAKIPAISVSQPE